MDFYSCFFLFLWLFDSFVVKLVFVNVVGLEVVFYCVVLVYCVFVGCLLFQESCKECFFLGEIIKQIFYFIFRKKVLSLRFFFFLSSQKVLNEWYFWQGLYKVLFVDKLVGEFYLVYIMIEKLRNFIIIIIIILDFWFFGKGSWIR